MTYNVFGGALNLALSVYLSGSLQLCHVPLTAATQCCER